MKTINVDEGINLTIEATKDTDFSLSLTFPINLEGGTVLLELNGPTTVAWQPTVIGHTATFRANYTKMNFPTGVYRYVITFEKDGSRTNLFSGNFIFKPRL